MMKTTSANLESNPKVTAIAVKGMENIYTGKIRIRSP
jgi:hypothetical protein